MTSVARASLEELRLDYEDFLRQRRLPQWPRQDPRRAALIARRPATAEDVATWAKEMRQRETQSAPSTQSTPSTYAEIAANGVLALITVASSLLDRQLGSLEKAFRNRRRLHGEALPCANSQPPKCQVTARLAAGLKYRHEQLLFAYEHDNLSTGIA